LERRLAAILAADVVGYTRLMGLDEAGTLRRLTDLREKVLAPLITEHRGRIVKLMGDGVLVEFTSAVDCVVCAMAWQEQVTNAEAVGDVDKRLQFRIGINLGDVIVEGDDIHGDGVNIAARLEGLAEPGGICFSGDAYRQVRGKIEADFEDLGERELKNVAEPVRVYRVRALRPDGASTGRGEEPLPLPDKPSIAVLPFANMSGDPEQEYFSDGITEDIITELSRFDDLFVIARNSTFSYKGKSVRVQEIARDLGVAYVVEGSVRKAGARVRITAQLIEAASGNHIWAERYDGELENIFDLQDEITRAIATVLPIRLQGAIHENARRKPSENLTAYDCYLRGCWLFDQTSGQNPEALALLGKAVELDPGCAHAYGAIAIAYAYSVFTLSPLSADPTIEARANIERALAAGTGNAFIHSNAADVYLICGDHDLAMNHSQKALSINPNDLAALLNRGFIEAYTGDALAGVEHLVEALRYNPQAPDYFKEPLAEAYYMLRDYEKAIEIYRRWQNPPIHMYTHLAACYAHLGRMDEAQAAAAIFKEGCPPDADFDFYAAAHARLCKYSEDAEHWLEGYRKAGLLD
jgi:adenylate cyclase